MAKQAAATEAQALAEATLRYAKASPQKTRLVVDQIRGQDVGLALSILQGSPKRVAKIVEKLLNSAIANAQNREERVDVDQLFVKRIWVDQAPPDRRGRPGSMGRFMPIKRRRSHIRVQLDLRKGGR
jgi:large subunit ribosomal protein L22